MAYIPALSANSLAVLFGGGPPIDGGKRWGGKRILGDGKTWRGLFGGGLSAGFIGLILFFALSSFTQIYPSFYHASVIIFSFSFGSLIGDIVASFVKRRMGKKRGEKAPMLDQYDFFFGSFLLAYTTSHAWVTRTYLIGNRWMALLIIIIIIPLLHRGVNIIGYRLGYKEEPW